MGKMTKKEKQNYLKFIRTGMKYNQEGEIVKVMMAQRLVKKFSDIKDFDKKSHDKLMSDLEMLFGTKSKHTKKAKDDIVGSMIMGERLLSRKKRRLRR